MPVLSPLSAACYILFPSSNFSQTLDIFQGAYSSLERGFELLLLFWLNCSSSSTTLSSSTVLCPESRSMRPMSYSLSNLSSSALISGLIVFSSCCQNTLSFILCQRPPFPEILPLPLRRAVTGTTYPAILQLDQGHDCSQKSVKHRGLYFNNHSRERDIKPLLCTKTPPPYGGRLKIFLYGIIPRSP